MHPALPGAMSVTQRRANAIIRTYLSSAAAFVAGARSALTLVFVLVLAGTYIGISALAHNFGLSIWWLALSTLLIFAAPAQVFLIAALGDAQRLDHMLTEVKCVGITRSRVRMPLCLSTGKSATTIGKSRIALRVTASATSNSGQPAPQ
jgi:hypothetical protein